ncbi:POTRA domain-containing protein [Danxiaibacter flavus]|uniref:POTRA domain-containing protein n=1 Tax=Danxiaibacter flavus TaxID=3049108 RepID=A0ABV3ZLN8_9BACT|nr:POTRA domain-containing protein [Chitinophagaceae bacterium DXS]
MNYFYRQIILWLCLCIGICASAQKDSAFNIQDLHPVTLSESDTSIVMVGDIQINGNKRTKPYIILREVPFKQGDYLTKGQLAGKLVLARQQVMNTSLFVDVFVYVASIQGEIVFVNVLVKERWYLFPLPYFKLIDRNFNQWWVEQKRSFDRVDYGIKFMQNNLSGRNDNLQVWLITGYNQQIALRYEQPFADKSLKRGFNIGVAYSRQHELNYKSDYNKQVFFKDEENFVRTYRRIDLSYLYRPAIKTRHSFRLAYISESVSDSIAHLNPDYFGKGRVKVSYPELSYSLQYFNVDYNAYPNRGFMGDFTITKRGFTPEMNMWNLEGHAIYTYPVFKKTQVQGQAAFSIRAPFDQPYYNTQLFGYGALYMRGLEYYVVDGVIGGMLRGTLRQDVLSFKIKTSAKSKTHSVIPFRFLLKTYGDLGYAYTRDAGTSMLSNKLLHTYGFGLDIVTVYDIVLKFEYSFNQLGDKALFFHTRSDF